MFEDDPDQLNDRMEDILVQKTILDILLGYKKSSY